MGIDRRIFQVSAAVVAIICSSCGLAWADTNTGGSYRILHEFNAPAKGQEPFGALVQVPDGDFFGTTCLGGDSNSGTIFRMSASGKITTMHSFSASTDGSCPEAAMLLADDGNLYGTAGWGAVGGGTVFRLTPAGEFAVLHTFVGGFLDGAYPDYAGLIQAKDGFLYGTTSGGGAANVGVAFRISTSGDFTLLHSFTGQPGDLMNPRRPLMQASDGLIYGTANNSGECGGGVIYSMTTSGTVTVLHQFCNTQYQPRDPLSNLVEGPDGRLYGTTAYGGSPYDSGLLYSITSARDFKIVASFKGLGHGQPLGPIGNILLGTDGRIYGMSVEGGSFDKGALFAVSLAGKVQVLHSFGSRKRDGLPFECSGLMQALDGSLVGTNMYGGHAELDGTVFRKTLP
jgi:uncharacterized repeat protein (TIGR03803 family)